MYFQNRKRFNVVVQRSKFYNFYSVSFECLGVFDRPIFYSKYTLQCIVFFEYPIRGFVFSAGSPQFSISLG